MSSWNRQFTEFRKGITKSFVSKDAFGIPIGVNYKGSDTQKSCFGACCSFAIFFLMMGFVYRETELLIDRTNPDRSSYTLVNTRFKDDALYLAEEKGQMYIGLRRREEFSDGQSITSFIDFDPEYINGKIDYYKGDELEARKNLEVCDASEQTDFA